MAITFSVEIAHLSGNELLAQSASKTAVGCSRMELLNVSVEFHNTRILSLKTGKSGLLPHGNCPGCVDMIARVVNGGCSLCSDLMRDALAAIGRYMQTSQQLATSRGEDAELLSKTAEQHRVERDQAVRLYENHMLQHRSEQFMTA